MELNVSIDIERTVVSGSLNQVVAYVEKGSEGVGGMVMGAAMALIHNQQKEAIFPLWPNEEVEQALFELIVRVDSYGQPKGFEMRFLEEVPAHG